MSVYALTPGAKADIFEIWSYIANDSEETAHRIEQAIYEACAFVAEAPRRGHSRSDLTSRSLRFWTLTRYPNYTIVYRPDTSPLQVVPVPHGKRNLRRILKGRQ
jgi:plasmid stabilization system protein ParE